MFHYFGTLLQFLALVRVGGNKLMLQNSFGISGILMSQQKMLTYAWTELGALLCKPAQTDTRNVSKLY